MQGPTQTKTVKVAGRSYTAWLIPGTEQHPCYATGDVDATVRALRSKRDAFRQEMRNDPNLARWRAEVERKLDTYEAEAETWRRTG